MIVSTMAQRLQKKNPLPFYNHLYYRHDDYDDENDDYDAWFVKELVFWMLECIWHVNNFPLTSLSLSFTDEIINGFIPNPKICL